MKRGRREGFGKEVEGFCAFVSSNTRVATGKVDIHDREWSDEGSPGAEWVESDRVYEPRDYDKMRVSKISQKMVLDQNIGAGAIERGRVRVGEDLQVRGEFSVERRVGASTGFLNQQNIRRAA